MPKALRNNFLLLVDPVQFSAQSNRDGCVLAFQLCRAFIKESRVIIDLWDPETGFEGIKVSVKVGIDSPDVFRDIDGKIVLFDLGYRPAFTIQFESDDVLNSFLNDRRFDSYIIIQPFIEYVVARSVFDPKIIVR